MLNQQKMTWAQRASEKMRRDLSDLAVQGLFAGMSGIGALDSGASADWSRSPNLRHYKDIAFDSHSTELRLDVHRPDTSGPLPALIHVHGGGFRIGSRKTHAHIADAYARGGYVVFNIDYRLGPEHPYPAPLTDVLRALAWVRRNGSKWGAETDQILLAGESAGGNLVVAASMVVAAGEGETFGVDLSDVSIGGVVSACGLHDVTHAERFRDGTALGAIITSQLQEARDGYLRGVDDAPWADPVRILRRWVADGKRVELPPIFSFAGTKDPLRRDAVAVAELWRDLHGYSESRLFEGGGHSFHAFMWRGAAKRAWKAQHVFLAELTSTRSERQFDRQADRLVG